MRSREIRFRLCSHELRLGDRSRPLRRLDRAGHQRRRGRPESRAMTRPRDVIGKDDGTTADGEAACHWERRRQPVGLIIAATQMRSWRDGPREPPLTLSLSRFTRGEGTLRDLRFSRATVATSQRCIWRCRAVQPPPRLASTPQACVNRKESMCYDPPPHLSSERGRANCPIPSPSPAPPKAI